MVTTTDRVTLSLTPQQVGLISQALAELPYRAVAGLMATISEQMVAQQPASAPEEEELGRGKPAAAKPSRKAARK